MDTKRIIVLGIALVAAVGAALMVRSMIGGGTPDVSAAQAPAPVAMTEVLVANTNLTPGQSLTAENVRWDKWPSASVDANAFITRNGEAPLEESVKGMVVRSPILTSQPVTSIAVVKADGSGFLAATLTPGMRAVSIVISAESGAGGFILPNDRIDVIQTRKLPNDRAVSRTILSDVRVLAVDQTAQQDKDAKTVVGKTATLEVTLEQAEQLSSAQVAGPLSLALRPLAERTEMAEAAMAPPARKMSGAYEGPVAVIRYGVAEGRRAGSEEETEK